MATIQHFKRKIWGSSSSSIAATQQGESGRKDGKKGRCDQRIAHELINCGKMGNRRVKTDGEDMRGIDWRSHYSEM